MLGSPQYDESVKLLGRSSVEDPLEADRCRTARKRSLFSVSAFGKGAPRIIVMT